MIETCVAIQNVCAWPNLKRLGNGTLIATIFNQPCHGRWEGDLDCWASEDEGQTWRFRGRPGVHEPGVARMNCAAGLAQNGDLIVLVSGWSHRGPAYSISNDAERRPLRAWVCRSSNAGATWQVSDAFPDAPDDTDLGRDNAYRPFGDIVIAADGSLCVSGYLAKGVERQSYLFRSRDDGHTWGERVVLNPVGNETAILHLGDGRWLASSRNNHRSRRHQIVELCVSEDDGHTWKRDQPLTLPMQVTSHLVRLADGRVMLSYGNRNWGNYGVDVRFSEDEGKTWSASVRIADAPFADCGYPSSVQLSNGRLVTAYYTKVSEDFHYDMRVAIWDPGDFDATGLPASGN